MTRKSIPESQYRELGEKAGLIYKNGYIGRTYTPVWWECCKCANVFEMRYYDVQRGQRCPKCARKRAADTQRIPEEQYHVLGKEKGLIYKPGDYTGNTNKPAQWFCPVCKNMWKANYASIQRSSGCPDCYRSRRLITEEQYHELAKGRGFTYLSGYTGYTRDSVLWECSKCTRRWKANYNNIQQGKGCPRCVNKINGVSASKIQIAIAEMLGGEVNYKLANKYIDIALPDPRIAIEFDGWYWHGDKVEEDRARAQEIINEGWSVLSIKGRSKMPSLQQIVDALAELESYGELVLDDWGKGKIGSAVFKKSNS